MNQALLQRLKAAVDDLEEVRPRLFSGPDAASAIEALASAGKILRVRDEILDQLGELVVAKEPAIKPRRDEVERRVRAITEAAGGVEAYGVWAFYPWNGTLVHLLPRDEFRYLRSDRNRHRISSAEQERLRGKRIGVVGLSLGGAIALTMVQEGIAGSFRLADFDRVSLTNLNRLRSSVATIGMKKTVVAAREIAEIDPYLEVELFDAGVKGDSLERFLCGDGEGKLDVVVEECDDLEMKLAVRERARDLQIPVVMFTGDRGVIDVERFDREPTRPLLHGLGGDLESSRLRGMSPRQIVPFMVAIMDAREVSSRSAASLAEFGRSVTGGPQLASMTTLGAGLTTDVVRRLLLGSFTDSGRFYVDPATVSDGGGRFRAGAPPAPITAVSPEATAELPIPPRPAKPGVVDREAVRFIVAHAALAPSGHNLQPWKFRFHDGLLTCRFDRQRTMPFVDFADAGSWLAIGAGLENLVLAARAIGLEPTVKRFPDVQDRDLAYVVRFEPRAPEESALFAQIRRRVTNRRRATAGGPLPASVSAELSAAVAPSGARLQLVTDAPAIAEVASMLAACDRISLLHPSAHEEIMGGMRFTRDEVEHHRDGLDLWTMDIDDVDRAGMQFMRRWDVAKSVREVGGGGFLEEPAKMLLAHALAVGLVTSPDGSSAVALDTGVAVQRMWLTAQAAGFAVHPMTILPYFFARLERGEGEGFDADDVATLSALRPRYRRVFDVKAGEAELFLFRIFQSDAPVARSLRRQLDDVISFE